ncbi:MAG: rhamnulokinase, partial [Ruminococcaceae bacterium]|nr:rhamnulokinase [Oscillospiraceae bacterium]
KIRYLTNIMGLWLIQESRRSWIKQGNELSFLDLENLARESKPFKCFIDPDAPDFGKPGDMPKRIYEYCKRTNQTPPETIGETVRCIYESLALKYKYALINLEKITNKKFSSINIVGGGTKDPFLCSMCADSCDVKVSAGPIEATALGNIAMCLINAGEIKDVAEARRVIKNSFPIKEYTPNHTLDWDKAYERFLEIIK